MATRSPGDFIRDELAVRGWSQIDLARIIDRPLPTVNQVILGKHSILPEMALALGSAFGTGPEIWMHRESAYKLSLVQTPVDQVVRRARLHELAPIREMVRRNWLSSGDCVETIEKEMLEFFEISSISEDPIISSSMRMSANYAVGLSASQRAWCFRVKQLAKRVPAASFNSENLDDCGTALRKLAAYPKEARKVSEVLGKFGVRFVVVEPLAGTKIDGATLWLDDHSPVIALSLRFGRIDCFWHTLCHELAHVRHRDAFSIDSDMNGVEEHLSVKPLHERRADQEAAALLIPPQNMDSFVKRVAPLFSKDRIIQFAHTTKIHPGIILGQLQYHSRVPYRANRDLLVDIRDSVTSAALTDGWGHSV